MRAHRTAFLIGMIVWFFIPTTATTAAESVSIMVGGLEKQIYLPFKLTEILGYFKDEGLTVRLLNQPSGVAAEDQMLAGAVEGVGGFYDHCVDLQSKGKFVESIVQISRAPGEAFLVSAKHPEIMSVADLKGKSLGVTELGSSTAFLTEFLAFRAGVKPGTFATVSVGAGPTFIAALTRDRIQAGMTSEPTITHLLKLDEARILVDLRSAETTKAALGGTYPAAALYMTTGWVETHREAVQKLANAMVHTLRWIETHSASEIADQMPKEYFLNDRDGYVSALANGKAMFTTDGVMPAGGPETVLAVLTGLSKIPKGKTIDLSKTYTTQFVKAVN
jgi:NitT/TauT family transport system substrate-binding protein